MDRDLNKIIDTIEFLFPVDSIYNDTKDVGEKLLLESIAEFGWRNLPKELLDIYKAKCIELDNIQTNQLHKNRD